MCYFLPFYTPNNPKNQNFEKIKNKPGDIIILHKCTKNHDRRLHCSWDTMCDICNSCFLFWAIFCPFTPLTTLKKKRKKKTPGDIIILHKCTTNHDHMMYGSWNMVRNRWTEGQTKEVTSLAKKISEILQLCGGIIVVLSNE